ncbi:MAG: hypothetical protein GF308_00895 [Candidatus Heimdallarchaeota archaeon]|nr:hypothetical protein [Candidatus Heimdallarchaeota archaeon]
MNSYWESNSDNKSIFYGKISENEYEILKRIMQSNEKINRKITKEEKDEISRFFNKYGIRKEVNLKMWFEFGRNYNPKIFGAVLKAEKFTPIKNNIRGEEVETFKWEEEINRAYLLSSNTDLQYLAIVGYRRDFDVLVDKVLEIISSSSQGLISHTLTGMTWTINEIEVLADRFNVNITQVYAK